MLANEILGQATTALNDADGDRYPEDELLSYLNAALRVVQVLRPSATQAYATEVLVAGTRQPLPTGAYRVLDVPRNMNADGSSGAAIWPTDRKTLDLHTPGWRTETPGATVEHYVYDPDEAPDYYEVYPPATAGIRVEVSYSAEITALAGAGDPLPVGDEYAPPLLDYVLGRAYSKNSELAEAGKAAAFFQSFYAALGADRRAAKELAAKAANGG